MLEMTRWNPSTAEKSWDLMDRLFNRSLGSGFPQLWSEGTTSARWMPPMDIRETDETYEVTAELPGLSKDDIDITVENNVLTVSGERRFDEDTKRDDYHRIERSYGAFHRSFSLPTQVDAEKVEAKFEDGMLNLSIPKREEAKPRRVLIH